VSGRQLCRRIDIDIAVLNMTSEMIGFAVGDGRQGERGCRQRGCAVVSREMHVYTGALNDNQNAAKGKDDQGPGAHAADVRIRSLLSLGGRAANKHTKHQLTQVDESRVGRCSVHSCAGRIARNVKDPALRKMG
jgi:hypothetical protein